MRLARNALEFIGRHGVLGFAHELRYRASNRWHERRLGVDTSRMVLLADLGIHNGELVEYTPIGYASLYQALRRIPLAPAEVSFVDFGAGKGRAVVVAGTFPFRKVIGVELSPQLVELARVNVRRMRHRQAGSVDVVLADATRFAIPNDVNVIYFFNPFLGTVLRQVISNILASYEARPRTMYIVYFNTIHFERLRKEAGYDWIRLVHSAQVYPNYSMGIYQIPAVRP
jgi:predicted RNA methylase